MLAWSSTGCNRQTSGLKGTVCRGDTSASVFSSGSPVWQFYPRSQAGTRLPAIDVAPSHEVGGRTWRKALQSQGAPRRFDSFWRSISPKIESVLQQLQYAQT